MWCKHCEQETFAVSVHSYCVPQDSQVSREYDGLRKKNHTVYDTVHCVYPTMHMLSIACPICCCKFKVGEAYSSVCISNKFGDFSKETWHAMWGPRRKTESPEHQFLLHLVDVVWGIAHEDESVPSTEWAERMIAKAKETFNAS